VNRFLKVVLVTATRSHPNNLKTAYLTETCLPALVEKYSAIYLTLLLQRLRENVREQTTRGIKIKFVFVQARFL